MSLAAPCWQNTRNFFADQHRLSRMLREHVSWGISTDDVLPYYRFRLWSLEPKPWTNFQPNVTGQKVYLQKILTGFAVICVGVLFRFKKK
jgi:hypothetical protein